jgi:hypothetical protein
MPEPAGETKLDQELPKTVHYPSVCIITFEPNALIGLEYTDEKWEVILFQENDNATSNPKGCLLSSDHRIALRGVAFSLMDVAADADNGKPVLRRNSTYKSTETFVVASVLLPCHYGSFVWDWQRFESTVAFGRGTANGGAIKRPSPTSRSCVLYTNCMAFALNSKKRAATRIDEQSSGTEQVTPSNNQRSRP